MKIWETKPPGTLWATPGLLRDSLPLPYVYFVFICTQTIISFRPCIFVTMMSFLNYKKITLTKLHVFRDMIRKISKLLVKLQLNLVHISSTELPKVW